MATLLNESNIIHWELIIVHFCG